MHYKSFGLKVSAWKKERLHTFGGSEEWCLSRIRRAEWVQWLRGRVEELSGRGESMFKRWRFKTRVCLCSSMLQQPKEQQAGVPVWEQGSGWGWGWWVDRFITWNTLYYILRNLEFILNLTGQLERVKTYALTLVYPGSQRGGGTAADQLKICVISDNSYWNCMQKQCLERTQKWKLTGLGHWLDISANEMKNCKCLSCLWLKVTQRMVISSPKRIQKKEQPWEERWWVQFWLWLMGVRFFRTEILGKWEGNLGRPLTIKSGLRDRGSCTDSFPMDQKSDMNPDFVGLEVIKY